MGGRKNPLNGSVFKVGLDSDVAADFGAASQLLVGSDAVDFFDEGVRVYVFKRFDFDEASAAKTEPPAIQVGHHPLVKVDAVVHGGLPEIGAVASLKHFDFASFAIVDRYFWHTKKLSILVWSRGFH